jgi:hypothetical protein
MCHIQKLERRPNQGAGSDLEFDSLTISSPATRNFNVNAELIQDPLHDEVH